MTLRIVSALFLFATFGGCDRDTGTGGADLAGAPDLAGQDLAGVVQDLTMQPDLASGDPCLSSGGAACFELPGAIMIGHEPMKTQDPDNSCAVPMATMSAMPIAASGTTLDLGSQMGAGPMTLKIFYGLDFSGNPAVTAQSDAMGAFTATLPSPAPNVLNGLVTRAGAPDVYTLGVRIDTAQATAAGLLFVSIKSAEAAAIPALVNEAADPSKGMVLSQVTDCDDRQIEHAVATLSSTSSRGNVAPTFVPGARVYYNQMGVPVSRAVRKDTGADGAFVILGVSPTGAGATYYLQAWGFPDAMSLGMGKAGLKLVGEKKVVIVGGAVTAHVVTPRSMP